MKSLIIYLSILIAIIALGICSELYLNKNSREMSAVLTELENQVKEDKETTAYKEIHDKWHKSKHFMELLTDHKVVLPIDDYISSLEVYLKDKDKKTETLGIIREIKTQINNIPHQMEFRFENLF